MSLYSAATQLIIYMLFSGLGLTCSINDKAPVEASQMLSERKDSRYASTPLYIQINYAAISNSQIHQSILTQLMVIMSFIVALT